MRPASSRTAASRRVQLLPAFDEYTVAYEDRSLLAERGSRVSKMALLNPAVLINGQVVGTWRRRLDKRSATITTSLPRKPTAAESAALRTAIEAYGEYLGLEARLSDRRL